MSLTVHCGPYDSYFDLKWEGAVKSPFQSVQTGLIVHLISGIYQYKKRSAVWTVYLNFVHDKNSAAVANKTSQHDTLDLNCKT